MPEPEPALLIVPDTGRLWRPDQTPQIYGPDGHRLIGEYLREPLKDIESTPEGFFPLLLAARIMDREENLRALMFGSDVADLEKTAVKLAAMRPPQGLEEVADILRRCESLRRLGIIDLSFDAVPNWQPEVPMSVWREGGQQSEAALRLAAVDPFRVLDTLLPVGSAMDLKDCSYESELAQSQLYSELYGEGTSWSWLGAILKRTRRLSWIVTMWHQCPDPSTRVRARTALRHLAKPLAMACERLGLFREKDAFGHYYLKMALSPLGPGRPRFNNKETPPFSALLADATEQTSFGIIETRPVAAVSDNIRTMARHSLNTPEGRSDVLLRCRQLASPGQGNSTLAEDESLRLDERAKLNTVLDRELCRLDQELAEIEAQQRELKRQSEQVARRRMEIKEGLLALNQGFEGLLSSHFGGTALISKLSAASGWQPVLACQSSQKPWVIHTKQADVHCVMMPDDSSLDAEPIKPGHLSRQARAVVTKAFRGQSFRLIAGNRSENWLRGEVICILVPPTPRSSEYLRQRMV